MVNPKGLGRIAQDTGYNGNGLHQGFRKRADGGSQNLRTALPAGAPLHARTGPRLRAAARTGL